jgi:hypothetical protein
MLKTMICLLAISLSSFVLTAQDVDYKKGMIKVDDADYAKLEVKKENFGLTKNFEVYNLAGEKIIVATVATEFESDKNDNSYLFYRLTFLTANQVGIFKVASLGQEKSFAKLIGKSGILVNDKADENRVKLFIAEKGASPSIAIDYTMVARNRSWPIELKTDKTIEQNSKTIGRFEPRGTINGADYYEYFLPSGVSIAKLSFTGGNNAQNMEIFTAKDNLKRIIPMPQKEVIKFSASAIDANHFTLKRITQWLVDNQYL